MLIHPGPGHGDSGLLLVLTIMVRAVQLPYLLSDHQVDDIHDHFRSVDFVPNPDTPLPNAERAHPLPPFTHSK